MASENAKAVAQEVIKKVIMGEKINKQKIQRKHGYSKASAKSMKATITKTYKEEIKPVIEIMKKERREALKRAMKVRNKAKYRDLIDSADKLTKNIQLLKEKPTEINQINLDENQFEQLIRRRTKKIDSKKDSD